MQTSNQCESLFSNPPPEVKEDLVQSLGIGPQPIQLDKTTSTYRNYNREDKIDQMAIFNRLPLSDEQRVRILAHLLTDAPLHTEPSITLETADDEPKWSLVEQTLFDDECKSPIKKRRRS